MRRSHLRFSKTGCGVSGCSQRGGWIGREGKERKDLHEEKNPRSFNRYRRTASETLPKREKTMMSEKYTWKESR